jgi:hypothetical protein
MRECQFFKFVKAINKKMCILVQNRLVQPIKKSRHLKLRISPYYSKLGRLATSKKIILADISSILTGAAKHYLLQLNFDGYFPKRINIFLYGQICSYTQKQNRVG